MDKTASGASSKLEQNTNSNADLENAFVNRWPKDPKSLLEARYQAFVDGEVDFILATHHPETRAQVERDAILNWSKNSSWKGLKIENVDEKGDKAFIRFTARYQREIQTTNHTENAEFRKLEGRWYYYDSEFPKPETIRRDGEKVGRNDPCPCGSGKKYKKCHALED